MAHLQYYAYPGVGEHAREAYGYNQAVRVGDRIEISGQGGWDSKTLAIPEDIETEIAQAFANVDLTLRDAGSEGGWKNVYRINSYHCPLDENTLGLMKKYFEKWMPDHKPIWTAVGVVNLGIPEMHVEIEVVAHEPASSKQA